MKNNNDNFRFFVDNITLEKAKDNSGREVMKIGGIASTKSKDSDDEEIDPMGYDVSYFLDQGFLNYNHQAKFNPKAVIGEPTVARITKDGLYVEGFLYPDSELAKSVYDTTKMLEKSSTKRRMGFSIEGKALERDPFNQNKITKARLTGLALTLNPKNPNTLVDIIKGNYHRDEFIYDYEDVPDNVKNNLKKSEEYIIHIERDGKTVQIDKNLNIKITESKDIDKSLSTLTGADMIPESMEKDLKTSEKLPGMKKKITKGEVFSEIFNYIYDVDLEKAEMMYEIVRQTAIKRILMETNKKVETPEITKDDLQKSLDIVLGEASKKEASSELEIELQEAKNHVAELEKSISEEADLEKGKMKKSDDEDEDDKPGKTETEDSDEDDADPMEKAMSEDEDYQKLRKAMEEYKEKFKDKFEKGEVTGYPVAPGAKAETMIGDENAASIGKEGEFIKKSEDYNLSGSAEVADLIKGIETTMSGAIERGLGETASLISKLAEITQEVLNKNDDLEKSLDGVNKTNDDLKKALDDTIAEVKRIGDTPIPSKSVTATNYRNHPTLEKSMDADQVVLHQDNDQARAKIIDLLDRKSDLGGANPNMKYAKAMTAFEAAGRGGRLEKSIIDDLQKSENIKIIG